MIFLAARLQRKSSAWAWKSDSRSRFGTHGYLDNLFLAPVMAQETTPSVQPSRCETEITCQVPKRLGCNGCVPLGTATGLECRRTNMFCKLSGFTMIYHDGCWKILVSSCPNPQHFQTKWEINSVVKKMCRIFSGGVSCLVLPSELWALKLAAGFLKEEASPSKGCIPKIFQKLHPPSDFYRWISIFLLGILNRIHVSFRTLEVYGTKNFRFANPRQAREPCLRLCDLCETGGPILGFHGDFLQPETQG